MFGVVDLQSATCNECSLLQKDLLTSADKAQFVFRLILSKCTRHEEPLYLVILVQAATVGSEEDQIPHSFQLYQADAQEDARAAYQQLLALFKPILSNGDAAVNESFLKQLVRPESEGLVPQGDLSPILQAWKNKTV